MKEKFSVENNQENEQNYDGQPVGLLYSYDSNEWSRPRKEPSSRAILNYNSIEISPVDSEGDNYIFSGEEDPVPASTSTSMPNLPFSPRSSAVARMWNHKPQTNEQQKYIDEPIRSPILQGRRTPVPNRAESQFSDTITLADSEKTDFTAGSTTRLVDQSKIKSGCSFDSWPSAFERGLSCVSLSACFGNVSRLPAMVAQHGGAPFLVAYVILIVLVGAPLVFLELGVGQIIQQGVTRTWRAVPMFRGVAYIKLVINMILCIYYPLYIGLALYYLVWLAKGKIPFTECAVAKISQTGYQTVGIPGEQCLNKTFLESPLTDSKWFGIYAAFLALIWIVIMLCSFRRVKAYIRSMNCFFIPLFLCLVVLFVKSIEVKSDNFLENIDWSLLQNADVWYFATIQLFFSTHLGFGNVVTCAGKVYNKADPFWAAFAYMVVNFIVGICSVSTCYLLMGQSLHLPSQSNLTTELYLFNAIYDHAVLYRDTTYVWTVLAYLIIFLSGFISMLAVVFTILKAIRIETKRNWVWWHTSAVFCFVFFTLGTFSILVPDLKVAHILDHYVVGNLLLFCTILEVGAFIYIYGCSNIYIDFEFILGSTLTIAWKILWWLAPLILLIVTIWSLVTVRLTGVFSDDPVWMYATGWTIVVLCLLVIIAMAVYELYIQVDYNLVQKISSALKPSRKWGPIDPILRHDWIQWRSTAGAGGERDFTLKRRGTRDYTHSVKNRRITPGEKGKFTSTLNTSSDLGIAIRGLSSHSLSAYDAIDHKQQNNSPRNGKRHPLEVVSITDTLERQEKPRHSDSFYFTNGNSNNLNPLGIPSLYGVDTTTNDSNSEGYGTIRNGPYVIANGEFDHVCWRKSHEQATEL